MKWLITGGCGFLGTNLADTLLNKGVDVVIMDNLSRIGARDNLAWLRRRHGSAWRFVEADIRNAEVVKTILHETKPCVVAHLAGQVAMTRSIIDPVEDFQTNVQGTMNVLEAVRLLSPETIVLYSSTNKVYGSLEDLRCEELATRYSLINFPLGIDESLRVDALSPYACSKLAAEQYVKDYSRTFALRTVVFRHSAMYGHRQYATTDQGWIGWFCQKSIEARIDGTSFTICGNGKQVRDVLHSSDLVACYEMAAAGITSASGKVFNIGGGMSNSLSLIELFALLESELDVKLSYKQLPSRVGDQKVFVANYESAHACFGWQPRVSIKAGVAELLAWSQEILDSKHVQELANA